MMTKAISMTEFINENIHKILIFVNKTNYN